MKILGKKLNSSYMIQLIFIILLTVLIISGFVRNIRRSLGITKYILKHNQQSKQNNK